MVARSSGTAPVAVAPVAPGSVAPTPVVCSWLLLATQVPVDPACGASSGRFWGSSHSWFQYLARRCQYLSLTAPIASVARSASICRSCGFGSCLVAPLSVVPVCPVAVALSSVVPVSMASVVVDVMPLWIRMTIKNEAL